MRLKNSVFLMYKTPSIYWCRDVGFSCCHEVCRSVMSSHFCVLKNQNNPSFFFLQTLYWTEWTGSDSKSDQTFRTLWLRCDPSAWGEQLTTTTRWITAAEQPRDVNNYWCISTEWVLVRNDRQQQVKCQHRPLGGTATSQSSIITCSHLFNLHIHTFLHTSQTHESCQN